MVLSFIGVVLSLIALVGLAYRGHSVIVVAPIAVLIAVLFSGAPLLGTYTQIFMPALGDFVTSYFPLFLFGAIFGYLMTATGLARYLARGITALFGPKRAMLSTVIATALLTYGGVSAWVVAFTIVPIATALFRESELPRRLMPAAIALGTITFALAALPGSPQIHNAIPTSYFGTNIYAAPWFGIISALLMMTLGMLWLSHRVKQLHQAGERFEPITKDGKVIETPAGLGDGEEDLEIGGEHFHVDRSDTDSSAPASLTTRVDRSVKVQGMLGLLPILVVIVVNFVFVYFLAGWLDTGYLAEEEFGSTDIDSLVGVWSPTAALATAVVVIVLMFPQRVKRSVADFSEGAKNAVVPCMTTASEVGYGAVIASLAIFAIIRDNMYQVSDNALVVSVVSTAVISGITGSSSGGLSITMQTLGGDLAELAQSQGISMELMHRVTAMASVSFDSLPHNGAILTMLIVCGMTHKLSYKDIAMVTVAIPLATLATMLGLSAVFTGLS
ncbi:GntP family permease [Corynebacterium endometrii]|uniref:Citrate transporter n=1 Tax=Corynebacterium endometrii TaxID=2488819 RepID=A0A4P7QDE3_9CORY|nr:GntP family permease [Corynebacterium endometrii]QCB27555.1 Citrate transporter [Corynebacterium endometrii]